MFGKRNSRLFALCLLLSLGAVASAQSTATGEIRGTVSDSTGAVIPKASISVLNVDTGEEKVFTTNNDGLYDTASTPHGHYKVTMTAPGFEKLVLSHHAGSWHHYFEWAPEGGKRESRGCGYGRYRRTAPH